MSPIETNINTDRECDHCGYNLKGLPMGGKCPECGTPVRRRSARTSGFMSEEAPTRFVRKLRLGFALASGAILFDLLGRFFGPNTALLSIPPAFVWVAGIYFITLERPGKGSIRPDKILDNDRMRLVVRLINLAWPAAALVAAGLEALRSTTGSSPIAIGALALLGLIIGVVSWLGMIPTSVYLAELAYWSSHDSLAHRMRGAAWILAVVGTLVAIMTGLGVAFGSPLLIALTFLPALIVFITILVYNFTFIQMTLVMNAVISHQHLAAGLFERVEERRKREEKYRGRIVDDTPCSECGYNLVGLEQGGNCPECGASFINQSPMAIRDPATTANYHDNSDLEVEEGENLGVFFNDQLDAYGKPKEAGLPYTPDTEVPDDGEIPLSMGDEEDHSPPDDSKPKQDSRDIDGIEPISFA